MTRLDAKHIIEPSSPIFYTPHWALRIEDEDPFAETRDDLLALCCSEASVRLSYARLVLGWHIEAYGPKLAVRGRAGGSRHLILGDTCNCMAGQYGRECYVLRFVRQCGGVLALRDALG